MACAKADIDIARLYARELGADPNVMGDLEAEFKRTVQSLHVIRERDMLSDHRFLQGAFNNAAHRAGTQHSMISSAHERFDRIRCDVQSMTKRD